MQKKKYVPKMRPQTAHLTLKCEHPMCDETIEVHGISRVISVLEDVRRHGPKACWRCCE